MGHHPCADLDQLLQAGQRPVLDRLGRRQRAQEVAERLLSGFGVVSIGLRDQGGDESAEQGLSASPGIVDELEEAEVGSFSWEMPRWGRNQERSSDQKPSSVLT